MPNKNQIEISIDLINHFTNILEDTSNTNEDRIESLKALHRVVNDLGRNMDYTDFTGEMGRNKNNHLLAIPQSIILAKDLVKRLKTEL
ncbi:hypothetical protein N7U66_04735 [Lacinutrix neustonica]|uniref:Uncharacterized protein n=1 Tax=Lacinutrix neustonica TaxID=2980107 RepID=A0A9E8MWK4_9FLAO|nr:hypothetical protein [Lacinutrix neustonica]WAC02938.1 hypothetical protein N7U66_04735 [Lacinutrix neustonica]